MKIIETEIEEVLIIEPKVLTDHRGWFTETYSNQEYTKLGINVNFVQDNHSLSIQKGTLRGLHFQKNPKAQTKLVRCTKGKILDVAVDLRRGSSTYKKWVAVELSEENKKQLLIPKGFAHGFLTLTDNVEVQYKVDEYYSSEYDRCIRYDDPDIGIEWGVDNPILSEKDINSPYLKDSDVNFSLKVLVTGANGQLGYDLVKKLKELDINVVATSRSVFDITNEEETRNYIFLQKPDIIIHCAAYTSVDKAESERELCYFVNVEGTRNISKIAKELNAKLVYISTDYVFDGGSKIPYHEDEPTNPINYYGYTKEQGESIVRNLVNKYFIIRTSWVFGANGDNFVKKILGLSQLTNKIDVVNDQIGAPTFTKDLAIFIIELMLTNNYGIYHGVNEGYCTWYEFAKEICEISGIEVNINPVRSNEYSTVARRPSNSRLSKRNIEKAGIKRLPHWKDALERFIKEIRL